MENEINAETKKQLETIVERIEKLEEEKSSIASDIKDVYAEAKGNGFDTKAIKVIVKLRKKSKEELQEEESILDTYRKIFNLL